MFFSYILYAHEATVPHTQHDVGLSRLINLEKVSSEAIQDAKNLNKVIMNKLREKGVTPFDSSNLTDRKLLMSLSACNEFPPNATYTKVHIMRILFADPNDGYGSDITPEFQENIFQLLKKNNIIATDQETLSAFRDDYNLNPWKFVAADKLHCKRLVIGCGHFDRELFLQGKVDCGRFNNNSKGMYLCPSCPVDHSGALTISLSSIEDPDIVASGYSDTVWDNIAPDSLEEVYGEFSVIGNLTVCEKLIRSMKRGAVYYGDMSYERKALFTAKGIIVNPLSH